MTKQLLLVTSCAFLLIAATAASGQTPNAAAIYKERCASCHDAGPGGVGRAVVVLAGVLLLAYLVAVWAMTAKPS